MSNTNNLQQKLVAEFQRFEKQINGESLTDIHQNRKSSFTDFLKDGLPDENTEEWKYTSIDSFKDLDFSLNSNSKLLESQVNKFIFSGFEHNKVVLLNGVYDKSLSLIIDENITVDNIDASDKKNSILSTNAENYKRYNSDGFIHINNSFFKNGVLVEIFPSKIPQLPLVIYYLSDSSQNNNMVIAHNKVIAHENSNIEIIEQFIKVGNQKSLTNCINEIFVSENAIISYCKILNEGAGANHIGTTQVNQIGKSIFNSSTFVFSGDVVRNNLNVTLLRSYSETHLFGLNLITGNTIADNHTVVDHTVPNCPSNETYKAVVDEEATSIFNGKIFVRPDAQKTNAYQSSKTILLSNNAVSNSKPQLEIWADDVKCSHGHATGQLDKDALFYLNARGIGTQSAKSMLTKAFAMDILNSVKIEPIKAYLADLVEERFA